MSSIANYVMYMSIPGIGKKSATDIMLKYPYFYDFIKSYEQNEHGIKMKRASIEFLNKLISESK